MRRGSPDGLLPLVPRPWSPEFGRAYLAAIRRKVEDRTDNLAYLWAQTLDL